MSSDIVARDEKYLQVREKAYNLDKDLEKAENEYKKEALKIIQNLQRKFYQTYGDKIHELEDLQDAINQYQNRGLRQLKRKLQTLYLEEINSSDSNELVTTGGGFQISKNLQEKAKKIYEDYRLQYCPDDNYQQKRDREAQKLQQSILGPMSDKDHNILYV